VRMESGSPVAVGSLQLTVGKKTKIVDLLKPYGIVAQLR